MKATVSRQPLDAGFEWAVVAEMSKGKVPAWKLGVLVGGLVLLLAGGAAIYFGVKPLAPLLELFTGGAQAAEKNQEFMEDLEGHLGAAAWPVGGGIAALLVGFVLVKVGMAPPKPKSVEELVQEEVARRLGGAASPGVSVPVAAPTAPVPAPVPVAQPSVRRTHCGACGSVLVAGGRLCPQGHAQG